MQRFFKTVEELKSDMAKIRGLQREVTEMNERGKTIVKTKEVQRHQEAMQVSARMIKICFFAISN
jgi:syntaxin 1B/2/3